MDSSGPKDSSSKNEATGPGSRGSDPQISDKGGNERKTDVSARKFSGSVQDVHTGGEDSTGAAKPRKNGQGSAGKVTPCENGEVTRTEKKTPVNENRSEFRALTTATRVFGRYELLMEVSHGGMATLYLAKMSGPEKFEKLLAIKKIHPHLSNEPDFIAMFLDEARIAALIQHPNVATIFDLGEVDNSYFIAMEYIHGQNLREILREAARRKMRIPWEYSASIIARAAAGLHAAHELTGSDGKPLHVVHRDVSPQNILLSYAGHVKVVDFGIAFAAEKLGHTAAGTLKGKAAYMSPEQANGERLDRRSDIFSLGIVLYESVCMRRLFRKETQTATLMRVRDATVPLPSKVLNDIPAELERIIMKSLAKNPDDRYSTTREMAEDLEELLVAHGKATTSTKLSSLIEDLFHDRKRHKDIQISQAAESPSAKVMKSVGADWQTGTSIELSSVTGQKSDSSGQKKAGISKAIVAGLMVMVFVAGAGYLYLRGERTSRQEKERAERVQDAEGKRHVSDISIVEKPDGDDKSSGDSDAEKTSSGSEEGETIHKMESLSPGSEKDAVIEDVTSETRQVPPGRIRLRVDVSPRLSGVRVRFAGRWYRGAVFEAIVPYSESSKDLEITAPGYLSRTIVVTPTEDTNLSVKLERVARTRPAEGKIDRSEKKDSEKIDDKSEDKETEKREKVLRDLPE